MSVTVAEIMKLPVMASAQVVAGHAGLQNTVRWVHVTELFDIARLLHGGELLLTTGLELDVPPEQQRAFVHDLHAIGAAGLGLELVRRFRAIPPSLAAAADEVGLPVIGFPVEVPFVEVTEAAHTLIVNRQYAQIQEAELVAATLNTIALSQRGVAAILRALAQVIGNPLVCLPLDPLEPAVMYPQDMLRQADLEQLREQMSDRVVHTERTIGARGVRTLSMPVFLGREHWGNLFVLELQRRLTELDTLVVDRAVITVAFELLRQQSMRQQWRVRTGELLEDILSGSLRDQQEVQARARELGFDLEDRWFTVVTIQATDAAERSRLKNRLRAVTTQLGLPCLQAGRGDRVRLLVAAPDPRTLSDRLARLLPAIDRPAGAGRPFHDLAAAPSSLPPVP